MYKSAIIVLGCGIDAEGNIGPDAEGSVQLGLKALAESPDGCIIMSGQVSYKADFRLSVSEAQAMKDYAVSLGALADKIFVETESKDTVGNLFFTKQNLLVPLHINNVAIVRGPNQSNKRISYLAQKILGDDYNFWLIEPDLQRPNEQEHEEKSLTMAKKWLDPVADGDMDAIYKLLRSKHPGYNSSVNIESLQELL